MPIKIQKDPKTGDYKNYSIAYIVLVWRAPRPKHQRAP